MRMKAGTRLAATLVAGIAALGFSATSALASTTRAPSHGSAATANSWTATASMSTARATPTATALSNGRILVVGGATAELYDPVEGAWSPAGTLSQPRSGYFVAVRLADGRVLGADGQHEGRPRQLHRHAASRRARAGRGRQLAQRRAGKRRALRPGDRPVDAHWQPANAPLAPHRHALARRDGPGRRRSEE